MRKMRGMLWVALVICLCLPMLGAMCNGPTPETEDKIITVTEKIPPLVKTAAPFLPPPFNLIALAIAGLAEGVTAGVAYRRKKRAVTAESAAKYEMEMKLRLRDGAQAFGDIIDKLRENPEHTKKVEDVLKLVDSYKRRADAATTQALGWFDQARKRIG